MERCKWVDLRSPIYMDYHDNEWCVPAHEDKKLFEMLLLESFQAGLSWITILKKREAFRAAFDGFDYHKIADYGDDKVEELMNNPEIIRCKRKITAAISNAQVFVSIQKEYGTFSEYIWSFTGGKIIKNQDDVFTVTSPLSDQVSKDLKKRGMKFVGSVIVYSYLQSIGIIDDHELNCGCYHR